MVIEVVAKRCWKWVQHRLLATARLFGALYRRLPDVQVLTVLLKSYGIKIIELDSPMPGKDKVWSKVIFTLSPKQARWMLIAHHKHPQTPRLTDNCYIPPVVKNMYGASCRQEAYGGHFQSSDDIEWYTEMLLANYPRQNTLFGKGMRSEIFYHFIAENDVGIGGQTYSPWLFSCRRFWRKIQRKEFFRIYIVYEFHSGFQ